MAYNTGSKFYWSFSGYTSLKEAQTAVEEMDKWFASNHDDYKEWVISSSATSSSVGFKGEYLAVKGTDIG